MSSKTILILGGYGGVGRSLAPLLLAYTDVSLVIAGRRLPAAEAFANELKAQFPDRTIIPRVADAGSAASLSTAFRGVDLVLLAATVPDLVGPVASAAFAEGCDFMDVLVKKDVVTELQKLLPEIREQDRIVVTQCGFHPGLVAPMVRYVAPQFDKLQEVTVAMAMNIHLPTAETGRELVEDAYDYKPEAWRDGRWVRLPVSHTHKIDFGAPYGPRACVPLSLLEVNDLPAELGIDKFGVYVSGFNWFVDTFVFSLIFLAGKIRKNLGRRFFQRLLKWGLDVFSPKEEWLVIQLEAQGQQHAQEKRLYLRLDHPDAYHFTAACVLPLIEQYLEGGLPSGDVHLMGDLVDPQRLMDRLAALGIHFSTPEAVGPVA